MSATKDFVALDWIKGDISQTLDQAQEALEAIAESADDSSSMRACLTALHQVHGTLRMLEIEGPTRLSGEMEELAQALMSDEVPDVPQAQEVLMQAMLQMPGYLDRIQREQRDTPEAVRGIINNMRLARGESKLDGGVEDLAEDTVIEALAKPPTAEVIAAFKSRKGPTNAKKLRKRFQQALIGVIKNADTRENLRQMGQTFTMLIRACGESPKSALFEMALALLEGIGAGAIKLDAAANSILKALDQEIRSLSDGGEAALAAPVSQSLGADILAAINSATRDTPRIISARDKFRPVAISKVDSITVGPDDETLSTVGRILMEELASVTDKLDLYVRSDKTDVKALEALIPQLEQIRSTMAVVGLGAHQDNITGQIETIKSLSARGEIPEEGVLLDIAGAFLKVESALRTIVGVADQGEDSIGTLSDAEIAVIKETRNSLALCKDSILDYIGSDFDKTKLAGMPELLKALGGGLVIINQGRIADVLVACAAFLQVNIKRSGQYPQVADMDDIADAITSVDYFFERYIVNPKEPYRQMLDVAEEAMSKLGFPPGQPYDVQEDDTGIADEPLPDEDEIEELPADEPGPEAGLTEDSALSSTVEGGAAVDHEIVEVFAEESREVLETLNEFFPVWQADPADKEPLTEVRRAFHTLKGSGRMVGAVEVGELAWSVENMLNRVLDESIEAVPEVFDVVSEAISCLPDGIAKFRHGEQESFDYAGIAARAATLAGGEDGNLGIATVEDLEFDESLFGEEPGSIESPDDSTGESLDEIFVTEAKQHVDTIREYVANPGRATPELVAAFHTLKGSAAMAKVPAIARIAGPLETLAAAQAQGGGNRSILVGLARDGLALIETVMQDLSANRESLPGLDEFCGTVESVSTGSAKTANRFDFENIRLLARVDPVLSTWDAAEVSVVMTELREAVQQAQNLGQADVVDLAAALLGVYERLGTQRPGDSVVAVLAKGHEQLVLMFDHLASSQRVVPAPDVVKELREFAASGQAQAQPTTGRDEGATELPADELDEEVLPLFLEEAEELEEAIDQSILAWTNQPDDMSYLDSLLRQLHTLKGGARLAGLNSLGEFAHNFETFLTNIQKNPVEIDEAFFALLNDQQDEISRRIAIYNKISLKQASAEEIESMRTVGAAAMPQVESTGEVEEVEARPVIATGTPTIIDLPEDELDMDVLPVFLEEAEELLEGIDQNILEWSKIPSATEPVDNLLRQLHTLKGGARVAGMASLGEYTHNFETFLAGLSKDAVALDEAFFELVNRHQDEINRRLGIYKRLATGEATDDELISMRTAVEPGDALAASQQGVTPEAEPAAGKAQAAGTGASQSAPSEMVRVSSELLEGLISLAGESSITRGRVEQQIGDFGDALGEMEETIERIREHVRRLEIEAESRETVLRSRGRDDDSGFDELEMDRYTMLQEISRALSEATSDVSDLKDTLVNKSRDSETLLHQQSRISTELQEGLTRTRMVPFARLIPRLRRIVRQISAEIGKSVRFDAYNVEGELDRTVLERIVAPLEHMLRNAVDHGIEPALDRRAAGKPEQGRISLRLSREGAYVVLTVSDDGAGINLEAVRKKAIERGLMMSDSNLSDQEIRQFIMHAGFSTAKKLTQISGRGVGLDVVASEIKQLGGTITIDSTEGVGTEFTIQLPFTVSINRALMVVVQDETYAIPLNTIEGIYRVSPYELEAYYQPDAPMFEAAGQPYQLVYMGRLLNKASNPNLEGQVVPLPVILARSGSHAVAFQVDKVIGSREVIVKSLGPQFNEVAGVSGATVMGDGSVVVILDVMALVRGAEVRAVQEMAPEAEPVQEDSGVRTVMIVDDSVTVRKVTSRLMERQGWEVVTAKDGIEAMSQLQEMYPDIMLLDIEMPRMDGFEVLRAVRRDERLKELPIIMITSRTGEKHKQQALELGVNRFLGKPFQEANLLTNIEEVISSSKAH